LTGCRVELFWVPLGLGPHGAPVRLLGRLYEAVVAARDRRPRLALYHCALLVHVDGVTSRIELAVPVQRGNRGVVAEGPVGSRLLARSRLFRFEVRRWPGGPVPKVPSVLDGPACVSTSDEAAHRVIALVPEFPIRTWGRDELGAGEMWNSNSLVSWLLVRAGVTTDGLRPPPGGRAPGWDAGLRVAARVERHVEP
jgi:hypothetical protein